MLPLSNTSSAGQKHASPPNVCTDQLSRHHLLRVKVHPDRSRALAKS
ncbi:unnamed protein product [Ectocarpus sp. 6 AP-2014]